jgi:ABC-type bacteriocin/lantibiotic exporter with double-glycine peptidase domain
MSPIRPYVRLNRMLAVDRREITHIYLYALVSGLINLTLPLGIQAIINLIMGGQLASSWGVLVVFVTIGVALTGALQVMQLALAENIKQKIFARSAFEFAYRLPRMRSDAVNGRYLPELVNRFFDINTVQKGLTKVLMDVPIALLQMVLGMILLAFYHPFFIAFGLVLALVLYLIFTWSAKKGLRTNMLESKYKYEVAYWLEEIGRSNSTFKLAGGSVLPMERTNVLANKYITARRDHFKVLLGQYMAMVGFKTLVTLMLLLLGGLLVLEEQMTIGQFVAAEIVILLIINAVEKLTLSIESIYDVLVALDKIGQVTDLPLERDGGMPLQQWVGHPFGMAVELRGVSFRSHWSNQVVLDNILLRVVPGERVCLGGANGAGKTSLLHMITGITEPGSGTVLIDDHPVSSLDLSAVRSQIGDSLTGEDVFSGTVLDNIRIGRNWIDDTDIQEASRITGLQDLLGSLPDGVLTHLDPHASRLPESFVQRLLLARCIAGRPRLLLIEDHLQALPPEERERLLAHVLDRRNPWTVIAVSNDPAVRARFDRSLVIEGGKLIPA